MENINCIYLPDTFSIANSYHQSFEFDKSATKTPMTLNHFKLAKEALDSDGKETDRTELWIFLNRGLMPMMKYASEFLPRTNRVVTRRYSGSGVWGAGVGRWGGWCLCNE